MADIRDVVKETRAQHLPLDAQIQKLQKFAERIRKLLMRPPSSTTPSALLSASAPLADALATCGKHVNDPRQRQSLTGRRRISYVDPAGPKGPKVKQHGEYKCNAPMQSRMYHKAVGMATFIYDALIKVRDLDSWTCLNKPFMASLPYSAEIKQQEVTDYIRNGYIMCQNILKAAQSRDRSLLEIGGNRKSRAKAHNSSGAGDAASGAESASRAPGADGHRLAPRKRRSRVLSRANARDSSSGASGAESDGSAPGADAARGGADTDEDDPAPASAESPRARVSAARSCRQGAAGVGAAPVHGAACGEFTTPSDSNDSDFQPQQQAAPGGAGAAPAAAQKNRRVVGAARTPMRAGTTTASDSGGADSDESCRAARRRLASRGGQATPAAAGGARGEGRAAAQAGGAASVS